MIERATIYGETCVQAARDRSELERALDGLANEVDTLSILIGKVPSRLQMVARPEGPTGMGNNGPSQPRPVNSPAVMKLDELRSRVSNAILALEQTLNRIEA